MIFVTLGTQDKEFTRLIEEIDRLIEKKIIKEEVIVQAGCTKYESDNIKMLDLIPHDEFEEYVNNCSLLITHGGVGSILTGIKKDKTVIAVPRLKKYNEHESDHQLQIINEFNKLGYIIGTKDVKELEQALRKARIFRPNSFESNNKHFINNLEEYIEKEETKKEEQNINKILLIGLVLLIFNISIRILLESFLITERGYELLSLIIGWISTIIIGDILRRDKRILLSVCKNSKAMLIEFILVLLIVVLPNITSNIVKIPIYIVTLIISYIANYLINTLVIRKK